MSTGPGEPHEGREVLQGSRARAWFLHVDGSSPRGTGKLSPAEHPSPGTWSQHPDTAPHREQRLPSSWHRPRPQPLSTCAQLSATRAHSARRPALGSGAGSSGTFPKVQGTPPEGQGEAIPRKGHSGPRAVQRRPVLRSRKAAQGTPPDGRQERQPSLGLVTKPPTRNHRAPHCCLCPTTNPSPDRSLPRVLGTVLSTPGPHTAAPPWSWQVPRVTRDPHPPYRLLHAPLWSLLPSPLHLPPTPGHHGKAADAPWAPPVCRDKTGSQRSSQT